MAQDPMKVDQLQIEPGAAGVRVIRRAADGSIEFLDAVVTGGLTLAQLAGLRNVGGVLIVGKSGAGAAYTTIQAAIDAIPSDADPLLKPYLVLICPGTYPETLNIVRDGVSLIGLGGVILQSAAEATPNGPGAYHTLVIQAALGTTPKNVLLQNLTIRNAHNGYACVRVSGGAASEVGSGAITLRDCTLVPRAAGGNRGLWATAVDNIVLLGCEEVSANGLALDLIENCADFTAKNCLLTACEFDYDTSKDQPSLVPVGYRLLTTDLGGSALNPALRVNLLGDGSFSGVGVSCFENVTVEGSRPVFFSQSVLGDLSIAGSAQVSLLATTRGTLTAGGTATLAEHTQTGTVVLATEATKAVVFAAPGLDANYTVSVETLGDPGGMWWVTGKMATGFTINFPAPVTLNVNWTATRSDL